MLCQLIIWAIMRECARVGQALDLGGLGGLGRGTPRYLGVGREVVVVLLDLGTNSASSLIKPASARGDNTSTYFLAHHIGHIHSSMPFIFGSIVS